LGRSYYLPLDLHPIPEQASDPGHLWNDRDTGELRSNAERRRRDYSNTGK